MRLPSALAKLQIVGALTLALLGTFSSGASAQTAFNDLDWLMDRGNRGSFGTGTGRNAMPWRQGLGQSNLRGNNPGPAVPLWVWPFTRDLNNYGDPTRPTNVTVDNPANPAGGNAFRTNPAMNTGVSPQVYPNPGQSLFVGGWIVPDPANRAPGGGYSFNTDTTDATSFDYAYLPALHNDFLVLRDNGTQTPATRQELSAFPNATPRVYRAVDDVLLTGGLPKAYWTSGQLFGPGRYAIEIHTPGDGTLIGGNATPNVTRAFVRVSWNNTVSGTGTGQTINTGSLTDPLNSRIFMVDLSRPGWIRLEGGGLGPAAFPFDGTVQNQITVTLYTVTPDRLDSPIFVNTPIVAADAVRFVPVRLETHNLRLANGEYIAASGRVLASAVGTDKIGAGVKPYTYIAREESLQDTILRSFVNPRDGTTRRIADPTAQTNVPVFYCVNGQRGNVPDADPLNPSGFTSSASKVIWRYVPVGNSVRLTDKDVFNMAANGSLVSNLTSEAPNADDTSSIASHRWVAFANNATGTNQIYLMNAFGKATVRLTTNTANDTAPKVSPNGRLIAFLSDRDGNPEIYVMSADGGTATNLTNSSAVEGSFVWSPDSGKVAFVSERDGNKEVYVVDANGANLTRLTTDTGSDDAPIWSLNGSRLFYVHSEVVGADTVYSIIQMDADGNNKTTLFTAAANTVLKQLALAPDNSKIAFVQVVAGLGDIFTMNLDGTGVTNITNDANDDAQPAWSPNSTKIAFITDRDMNKKVYVMNADGTSPTRLNADAVDEDQPRWSPDNARVIFTRPLDGKNKVYQVRADGTELVNLTPNTDENTGPDMAVLRTVAFVSDRDGNPEVYSMNADGTNKVRLTSNGASDRQPSWSPTGMKVVFTSARSGRDQLYVMDWTGANVTRLTNNNFEDSQPAWSPDGTKIVFVSNRDGNPELYTMNPDGSGQTRISTNAASDLRPAWSPDGKKILFTSNRGGSFDVYVINPDGTGIARLTNSVGDDVDPAWSPNGLRIAFTTNRNGANQIFLMDPDGGNLQGLTTNFGGDTEPAWSVDGTNITFTRQNLVRDPLQGSSSPLASALLANVRCRDGNTRTMAYFVISTGDTRSGRIFALDAMGAGSQQTFAYWAYPSIRPLINPGAVEPLNAPAEYQDPNYKLATGVPPRTGYPNPLTWGADGAASQSGAIYYDGDIITNPLNPTQTLVRNDTRVPQFGGVFGSPILQDDSANATGTQLLLVPNMNGRIYAFDAGGRGDFTGDGAVAGTTQRIFTWPHLGVDAFRHLSDAAQALTNRLADEPSKVAFPASLTSTGAQGPVVAGSADGHVYNINIVRDLMLLPILNNTPRWQNRLRWLYPGADETLGAPVSTVAYSSFGTNRNLYFTSGGRVYAIDSATPAGTAPSKQNLVWVYPPTPNPPNPADPAVDPDGTTLALDPGFSGNAPLVQDTTLTDGSTQRICYALQSNGRLFALNADNGAVLATGRNILRQSAHSSPIGVMLTPQDHLRVPELPTGDRQAVVFADDSGAIQALSAAPITVDGGPAVLPVIWGWFDSRAPRSAGGAVVGTDVPVGRKGGTLLQGDEGGQVRAYGFGGGAGGNDPTPGPGEPIPVRPGDGTVSIDIRLVDIYDCNDYRLFGLSPNDPNFASRKTPGFSQVGTRFARTADPIAGNLGAGTAYAYEWGDYVYVAAWGVYKGVTTDVNKSVHGTTPPRIEVTFTFSGQNVTTGRNDTLQATVPAYIRVPANGLWHDDSGVEDGEADQLSMFGLDPNDMMNPGPKVIMGPNNYVYPWVAVYRVPRNGYLIQPRQNVSLVPGTISISAFAQARQQLAGASNAEATDITQTMFAGQRDLVGKSASLTQLTPEQIERRTPERRIYVAHPLGFSARGIVSDNNTFREAVLGISAVPTLETLANGNRVLKNLNANTAQMKSVFAPVGMIPPGSSRNYAAVNDAGGAIPGLIAVDRTNLAVNTGRRLSITAATRGIRWAGTATSVMNPLPWETMPNIAQDSSDYPHISPEAIQLNAAGGQSLLDTANSDPPVLQPPTTMGNPMQCTTLSRVLNPTLLDLSITVPRFQPASVNFGMHTFDGRTFGSGYRDISGRMRGANGLTDPIIGPLLNSTGISVPGNSNLAYPSAGYISDIILMVGSAGQRVRGTGSAPYYEDTRNQGIAGSVVPSQAYRALEFGITVPPSFKMRIAETTLDFGKQPHGTGYSDLLGDGSFRAPFAPSRTRAWAGVSPWDSFFRPLTIYNESNINLVRPRIAKLLGTEGSSIGAASLTNNPPAGVAGASRLVSDQVDILSNQSIFGIGFAGAGVGNIGLVSSLDHFSKNDANFRTLSLWPILNPYVNLAGVNAAGLPTADDLPNGILGWTAGRQPHPTVHKPRVGDSVGPFMTVPDAPYGATEANDPDRRPKIGVAIPLGTPSGTYSNPIFAYEDYTPVQWRAWLNLSQGVAPTGNGANYDGILNVNRSGAPLEAFTDPAVNLKVTVTESQLTDGFTQGTLRQIDNATTDIISGNRVGILGLNLQPTAIRLPSANPAEDGIALFWSTNRDSGVAGRPYNLAYSFLRTPMSDSNFSRAGTGTNLDAFWWTNPALFKGGRTSAELFPSSLGEAQSAAINGINPPYLPGVRANSTERHESPTATVAVNPGNAFDRDAVLFWAGSVAKVTGGSDASQVTDSRIFYSLLTNGVPGTAASLLNDPALPKLSPRPLFLKLPAANGAPAQQFLFLFWYAGKSGQTNLYYNVNINSGAGFLQNNWSRDIKLPTPGALVWQSDPYAVYRRVTLYDSSNRPFVADAIDVMYTGILKNRQTVEVLLTRYLINRRGVNGAVGTLSVQALPQVVQETAGRAGSTSTFTTRDAGWIAQDANNNGQVVIQLLRNGAGLPIPLNNRADGTLQRGRYDAASGLLYYDSALGGQIVVDTLSGAISFPNVPPGRNDALLVSYIPAVMRLNSSRDDSNVVRTAGTGAFDGADPIVGAKPGVTVVGNHYAPIGIMDRMPNPRTAFTAPQTVFNANGTAAGTPPSIDRLWVLYRKSDPQGTVRSTIYYKAMRLQVRLPRPVALSAADANGNQQILSLVVAGNLGPYEVDWVRGRVYFTEVDEGRQIQVRYTPAGRSSVLLTYRVGWGDEITVGSQEFADPLAPLRNDLRFSVYQSTPEVVMPSSAAVNEGQVSAFKDPFYDKLWVFWSSSRGRSTDLFYQTIAPNLYPTAANQR